jgi:hypothetical protein
VTESSLPAGQGFPAIAGSLHGCWTGLAPAPALLRVMPSSRLQWMRRTEADPLGLKALATMRARPSGRSLPSSSSIRSMLACEPVSTLARVLSRQLARDGALEGPI